VEPGLERSGQSSGRPVSLDDARFNFATVIKNYLAKNSQKGYWEMASGLRLKFLAVLQDTVHELAAGGAPAAAGRPSRALGGAGRFSGQVEMTQAGSPNTVRVEFVVNFGGDSWTVEGYEPIQPESSEEAPPDAESPSGAGSAERGNRPLGGGYKRAKWGMSPEQVMSVLLGRLEYRLPVRGEEQSLVYDLEQGQKLTCLFFRGGFYRAALSPVPSDARREDAEAVFAALQKKYGTGKELAGYVDGRDRPWRVAIWNDGVSEIQFRMPDFDVPDPAPDPAKLQSRSYPGSDVSVLYTSLEINTKRPRPAKGAPGPKQAPQLKDNL
jgi:hypothetical protein